MKQIVHDDDTDLDEKKPGRLFQAFSALWCLLFIAVIFSITALSLIIPDKKQSDSENRMLQQMPKFSLSSVIEGSFMQDLESYMTDQFPERDLLVRCKTYIDLLCGKEQINGVYVGSEDYLFEPQTPPHEEQIETITSAMNKFCAKNAEIQKAVIISPNSTYILKDKVPYGVQQYDQSELLGELSGKIGSNIKNFYWADCAEILDSSEDGQLYYRTDHHWTTRAAYRVFLDVAKEWGLETDNVQYDFAVVSDSFQGTLASSSGICHINDEIEICIPHDTKGNYVIEYDSENIKKSTFFDISKLKSSNQYEIFMGGNFGRIIISTTAKNDKSLLIFKDSYANCMIPMFAPYFSQIVVIDPRYFNDTIDGCMQDYDFTNILFVYNLNTFLEDKSLADTLEY